ncbi:hypothetical protein [Butyrivibrio sp. M55]|uniref:hypothetical protein n=1 Tax=Butyrivibrio sp. M55 TaxID=1855323 RepID=UPI0008E7F197|nr:hypothetical protein [Butyrivibrio sp. M55]SFU85164.1 hypothetical protein SAMN05216540_11426 [Butyrivibrio sp. M55]
MKKKVYIAIIVITTLVAMAAYFAVIKKVKIGSVESAGNVWDKYEIVFDKRNKTKDNPWGYTVGKIDDEVCGESILLTPNTSFTIKNIKEDEIALKVKIHPWVSDKSDGIGIDVWFMNETGEVLGKDTLDIDNSAKWHNIKYQLGKYDSASQIKILCNNGKNNDDVCDWLIVKPDTSFPSDFGTNGYVRSVTYYGNVWPINFWNSEMENLDQDFKQIVDDGFNSIIICIPWKEFQPNMDSIEYNDYAFANLNKIMEAANKNNLDVYTRIGYTWDYYNDSNEYITERYLDILRKADTKDKWLDYCKSVYEELSKYTNFKDGFLTWEDFWGCLAICDAEDEKKRVKYAYEIGYQKWIEQNYGLDKYNDSFACGYETVEAVPVPNRTEPAMEAFYNFYDSYINELLLETQSVFPNISLEVRMDADLITDKDGENKLYDHSDTYTCETSDYTATMYGIPMGFENKGEKVTSDEALNHTEYILNNLLNKNSEKPVYVEQFLFMDNTPQFSYNAQIKENEVGKYLEDVSDVLLEYTKGYGIWTYRDYKNNMFYNSQFARGDAGWKLIGAPSMKKEDAFGTWACYLQENDGIAQEIPPVRNHFPKEDYIFEFDVLEKCEAEINIKMGNESKSISVSDKGTYSVSLPANDSFDFEISVIKGATIIDNMCLYSFIQEGHLYDSDDIEQEHIDSIRILNEELKNAG